MKERGLLPLPAAPPSGMLGSIRSAAREGGEASKDTRRNHLGFLSEGHVVVLWLTG